MITFLQDWEVLELPSLPPDDGCGANIVPKLMTSKLVTSLPVRADAALNLKILGAAKNRLLPLLLHVRCQTGGKVAVLTH
jgi:hypothetical protein